LLHSAAASAVIVTRRKEWHKARVGEKGTRQSVRFTYLPIPLCSIKLLSVSREKISDLDRGSYAEFGWKVVYNQKSTLLVKQELR
jgi:hypothetical protein